MSPPTGPLGTPPHDLGSGRASEHDPHRRVKACIRASCERRGITKTFISCRVTQVDSGGGEGGGSARAGLAEVWPGGSLWTERHRP